MRNSKTIKEILEKSQLKYNQQGEMYFFGDMYLTHWQISETIFESNTYFTDHDRESFVIEEDFYVKENEVWHEFGFTQNLINTANNKNISPFHKNSHFELYYVNRGNFEIKIENKYINIMQGEMILLNENTFHSDVIKNDDLELFILGFNNHLINSEVLSLIDTELATFLNQSLKVDDNHSETWHIKPNETAKYKHLIESLVVELSEHNPFHHEVSQYTLYRLLIALSHENSKTILRAQNIGRKTILFNEVHQYMTTHYKDMTLEDLADYMKFSKDYFNRLIKEITGMTYTEYLQDIRIKKACELLKETNISIREISESIGYSNISHFYDIFRKIHNMTPHEYRNMTS